MNGTLATNEGLLEELLRSVSWDGVVVCAPFVYLQQVQSKLDGSKVFLGAQDVSIHPSGAFTGEVSAAMLREFGCHYVIVGHSERRALHSENDIVVADKAAAALASGLVPIVCVGESISDREQGDALSVIRAQLMAVADRLGPIGLRRCVVAYEPVWAIGTGKTATPELVQKVHGEIRRVLNEVEVGIGDVVSVLYGGSVKASNAKEIFSMPDVDGGLIGGASLVVSDFLAICKANRAL